MAIEYVSLPGEAPPPVPDGPKACSGDEMRILHNAFLWAYEQAPELIRSASPGDIARSEFVGQWLADLDATLHTHHESEDDLLWGKIEQRSPACALHVGQMRAHHAQVGELLDEAGPLLSQWRATADPAIGEQLIDAYARTLDVLKVHLRREVVEIVPVAEKVLTQKEWDAIGEHSMGAIPKSRLLPQLGMLLANSTPADRAAFYATVPGPVKVLWR
ncbi:MAG TPA: hemerythrin domain-containing protein, partial [Microbacterium sp.]|nr:hemerythrin domain-containing protein [Microbacterium sp.]